MARRSQRIAIKEETTGAPAYTGSDVASDSDDDRDRPAAKARRVDASPPTEAGSSAGPPKKVDKTTRAPRKRGKLHQILDMPLDVLMEIASQMQTREMLYLSRLSKAFRTFFTSRSTQFIWTAARENVSELPPLPEDLNEMQYASLLYDTHCHRCMSKNCYFVYWACRIRLCKRCLQESAINLYLWHARYKINEYHLYDSTTKELLNKPRLIDELVPVLEEYQSRTTIHYKPYLDQLLLEWKALPEDEKERKAWMEKRKRMAAAQLKSEPALERWYAKYRTDRADELSDVRSARKDAILQKLEEEGWHIELKCIATSPEDEKKFSKLPEVRKSQALTPRIWNTIKEPISAFMQDIRNKRLHVIYMDTLTSRVKELHELVRDILEKVDEREKVRWKWSVEFTSHDLMMCVVGLVGLVDPQRDGERKVVREGKEEVTEVKKSKVKEEAEAEEQEKITEEEKDAEEKAKGDDISGFNVEELRPIVEALIRDYFDTRQAKAEQALATALREMFNLDKSVDPFTLAVGTYFNCTECARVYTLPNVLYHRCSTYRQSTRPSQLAHPNPHSKVAKEAAEEHWKFRFKPEWMPKDYFTAIEGADVPVSTWEFEDGLRPWMWSVDPFRAGWTQFAKVIAVCGLDVKSATVEDLDGMKVEGGEMRLICTCHVDRKNKYVPVMSWRTAAFERSCCSNFRHKLSDKSGPSYKLATKKYVDAVKESEAACVIKSVKDCRSSGWMKEFACGQCDASELARGVTWKELCAHLQEKHSVAEPGEDDWRSVKKDEEIPEIVFLVSHKVKGKEHSLKYMEDSSYTDRRHLITYYKFPAKGWP